MCKYHNRSEKSRCSSWFGWFVLNFSNARTSMLILSHIEKLTLKCVHLKNVIEYINMHGWMCGSIYFCVNYIFFFSQVRNHGEFALFVESVRPQHAVVFGIQDTISWLTTWLHEWRSAWQTQLLIRMRWHIIIFAIIKWKLWYVWCLIYSVCKKNYCL